MDIALNKSQLRLPATLLAISPLTFIALVVSGILVLVPNQISLFDNITPEQMATIKIGWISFHIIYGLAVIIGASGLILLNERITLHANKWLARIAIGTAGLAITAIILHIGLRVGLINFSELKLSLAPNYSLSSMFTVLSIYVVVLATAVTGFNLYATSVLRRAGLMVAILCAIHFLIAVVIANAVPPFVVSIWWLAIGVGLLRRDPQTQ